MTKAFRANAPVAAALGIQALCTAFFVYELAVEVFGIGSQPLPWRVHELIEIGAVLGLMLGGWLGYVALRRSRAQTRQVEGQLAALTGAFHELLEDRFSEWGLTPAEKDVALLVVKGFSTAEIAGVRETSEGTVKAQTNAIYRKAGVTGRVQLLSLFIDDLFEKDAA